MANLPGRTVMQGDPPSPSHQPSPTLIGDWMTEIEAIAGIGGIGSISTLLAATRTFAAGTYLSVGLGGAVLRAVDSGATISNAGGQGFVVVTGPEFADLSAEAANELTAYPDGTAGVMAGLRYVVDSSIDLEDSAAHPVGVAGLRRDARRLGSISTRTAHVEQFISLFHGRGMLASETNNLVSETSVTAAAGVNIVNVGATTNFTAGGQVVILHDNGKYAAYSVWQVGTGTLAITPSLKYDCLASGRVERMWYDRAHPGKFGARLIAQRLAEYTETDAALARRRVAYADFTSNPNTPEDTMIPVGAGSAVSYFDATSVGAGGGLPPRFLLGRSAFVDGFGNDGGFESAWFGCTNAGDLVAKIGFFGGSGTASYNIAVLDQDGDVLAERDLAGGTTNQHPQIITLPFSAGNATRLKVRLTATANAGAYMVCEFIDIFHAPDAAGLIIPYGATTLWLGDSWWAGYMEVTAQREPAPYYFATLRPDCRVINKGTGGNKIRDMLVRFETDVVPHEPDVVILNTGTNDVYGSASGVFNPTLIDMFYSDLAEIERKCRAIGARLIVNGVPALAEDDPDVIEDPSADDDPNVAPYPFDDWAMNFRASYLALNMWKRAAPPVRRDGVRNPGRVIEQADITVTSGGTIDVSGDVAVVALEYGAATNVTNLTGGVTGQIIKLVANNANATLKHGTFKLPGAVDIVLAAGEAVWLRRGVTSSTSAWYWDGGAT